MKLLVIIINFNTQLCLYLFSLSMGNDVFTGDIYTHIMYTYLCKYSIRMYSQWNEGGRTRVDIHLRE